MRVPLVSVAFCVAASAAAQPGGETSLQLVKGGVSSYRIVVPKACDHLEMRAATELQDLLRQATGAYLSIGTDALPAADLEIVLGRSERLGHSGLKVDRRKLGDDGFTLQTAGKRLFITGGSPRGTLYGVYAFLEDRVGYRWYTPTVSKSPKLTELVVPSLRETQVPAMVYRNVYYSEARDRVFCLRRKLTSSFLALPGETCDNLESGNGLCHTVFNYLPPDTYFAKHPDYYALWNGKRQPTQICLSNPEVLKILVANLSKAMNANPQYGYWNVSQMDNGEYCTCPKCKALDDREGSPAGSALTFVNKVAARFPSKTISTLAYWYTTPAPKTVKPAKNVQIIYCTDGQRKGPIYDSLLAWAKIAPRRYNWYYVIPCHNMMAPWPNILLLQPIVREFVDLGCQGMFVEGINESGSEFAELRVYLLSKLMWNPRCDLEAELNGFLKSYYGDAGPILREYIQTMFDAFRASGEVLDGHDWCRHHAGSFFTPAMFARYDALFDRAEKAAEGDPGLLLRVQHARMPLMHAELQLAYGDVDRRIAMVERLRDLASRTNVHFFADFGERPTGPYLDGVMAGLKAEKARKG